MVMFQRCPLGVAFYDDEGCIGCELCTANSVEEMAEAQERLDKYLSLSPQQREEFVNKSGYFDRD